MDVGWPVIKDILLCMLQIQSQTDANVRIYQLQFLLLNALMQKNLNRFLLQSSTTQALFLHNLP
jgi:hypothetical protein